MSYLRIKNVVLSLLLAANVVFLSAAHGETTEFVPSAKIGREGTYLLRTPDAGLVVREAKERSPVIVRIANDARDGNAWIYDLRFIGSQPGKHDLCEYLARSDGSALSTVELAVNIEGVLPAEHDGGLESLDPMRRPRVLPYRRLLQGGLILWLAGTIFLGARALRRGPKTRQRDVEEAVDPLPALIERALADNLDPAGQARLEMLILQRRLRISGMDDLRPEAALRKLRSHPESRQLLADLENWLHARPGSRDIDLESLLSPYRAPPVTGGPA